MNRARRIGSNIVFVIQTSLQSKLVIFTIIAISGATNNIFHKSIWYCKVDDTINYNFSKRTDNKATIIYLHIMLRNVANMFRILVMH